MQHDASPTRTETPDWFGTLWQHLGPPLTACLTDEDDLVFWRTALGVILADAEFLAGDAPGAALCVEFGCCIHWQRPHQNRWAAAGGFAWPEGYARALPEHQWTRALSRIGAARWELASEGPPPRGPSLRVSLPGRTARHAQAAVHTLWPRGAPGREREPTRYFYGFRKHGGAWHLVADGGFCTGPSAGLFTRCEDDRRV